MVLKYLSFVIYEVFRLIGFLRCDFFSGTLDLCNGSLILSRNCNHLEFKLMDIFAFCVCHFHLQVTEKTKDT